MPQSGSTTLSGDMAAKAVVPVEKKIIRPINLSYFNDTMLPRGAFMSLFLSCNMPGRYNHLYNSGRRTFIKNSILGSIAMAGSGHISAIANPLIPSSNPGNNDIPWYRRLTRWGQVNITEKDPQQYDVKWWRSYWKKTHTQGVIINAGGIVAYYPSKVPLHRQATFLEGIDLFGQLCKAAHDDGLAVFARMDSNRAHEEFYKAHPDWFAVDKSGKPYQAGDLYLSCIFGPYYTEHIPAILTEIATTYHPEGFTDNSWSGITRDMICHCVNCKNAFLKATGKPLPQAKDWDDPVYRQWIRWNYERRLFIWDLNNTTTKKTGGEYCTWSGMNSGSISSQSRAFRNYREICKRADIIMLDHQARGEKELLQHNTEVGMMVHSMAGWDKLMPESMAMYQAGFPTFRLSAKPTAEARMWMINGMAGGIQPWWHHVAAYHEDRRAYDTVAPVMTWHKANEQYLVNRKPVASVGIIWSQQNTDFFGRDSVDEKINLPWSGVTRALVKARIPYVPIHADDIAENTEGLSLLILPNIGSLSASQLTSIRNFVKKGGSLLATGETSLFNEEGERQGDFALSDIFGVHRIKGTAPADFSKEPKLAWNATFHTYLRLHPEWRKRHDGPINGSEPAITGERHAILAGFEKTDILPFGDFLEKLEVEKGVTVPLTFIPQFPVYPPETAWMRDPSTDIGAVYLSEKANRARVVFMPAAIDRLYAQTGLPDHARLLKNIIGWALKGEEVVQVEGSGLISCVLYEQKNLLILHLVNQTSEAALDPPLEELIAVGPLQVKVKLRQQVSGRDVQLRVSERRVNAVVQDGWTSFTVPSLKDHEMILVR